MKFQGILKVVDNNISIMSSSRRSSKQLDTSSEFFLECKAAFLAIYDDIGDKIESKKRLNIVLQQSGRNPSRTALDKYWTRDTEELSFNDFVDICRKEPVTTADDLMKAFRKIDLNGDGYISLEELYKIMNAQGEQMTRDDVRKIIDEVDENKDGRLDYSETLARKPVLWKDRIYYDEFTNMVMKTTEESKKFSMKVMEKKERKKKRAEKLRSTASNRDPGVLLSQSDKPDILTAETKRETKQEENQPQQASDTVSNTEPDQTVEDTKLNSPHSSVEEWVNSLPPEVCKAPSDITEWAGENDSTNLTSKKEFGSKISLKSKDQFGSKTSLKSTKDLGSKVSLKPKEVDSLNVESEGASGEKMGSQVSLRSAKQKTGSQATLRSIKEPMGSQASLKSVKEHLGPQASVRSIKEQMGSQSSVRSVKEQMGSQVSIRSVKGANLATEASAGQESAKKESPKASPRSGSPKVSPRSPKVSPRSRTNSASKPKSDKPTPREKVTPRRESLSKNDKPPLPESPKSKDKAADKPVTPKTEKLETTAAGNSARTVGEEISYDDDFDIISTGRPTPRVDLNSTRSEDKPKDSKLKDDKTKEETKEAKDDKTEKSKGMSQAVKKDENGLGSQLSVRSGDVPKPSPRVTKGKGRSSSIASKDAMPDPKSLRDWSHSTSKGCFFYEEDEIVTHVYSLKLAEDSMVYLCAYPIQEPACLNLPGTEPVDTALFVFDSRGKLVICTEDRDTKGTYGVKCELSAGQYEILPYTTGCRFRQRGEEGQHNIKESKLVKTKDDKVVITTAFRKALEDIFDLCDLDNNGTMSRDEFNWFNLRTSGEELGEDEWEVVEEKTALENGEITKKGFIELNEMEAEDAAGDVEDLWITLTSMGMNKGLIMDEACPFRVDVYVESARKTPRLKVTGIESIEKKEYRSEICQYIIEKADEPVKIRSMKDLYKYTYKTDLKASIVIDNRSRSSVNLEVDCSKSKNAISNRPELKHTVEINPQDVIIAHHLMPKSELSDWTVTSTEEILK